MSRAGEPMRRIEEYLEALRAGLRGLPRAQADDIVEEIRGHLLDRAGGEGSLTEAGAAAALEALGRPADLAAAYVAEILIARAGASRAPWRLLGHTFRLASLSLRGAFLFLQVCVGYGLSASFLIAALMKPVAPGRAGLWRGAGDPGTVSLHLGFVAPGEGTELLGWWIVPIGLAAGAACVAATTWLARRGMRRLRGGLAVPALAAARARGEA